MATRIKTSIHSGIGGINLGPAFDFPTGYNVRSTLLGNTFPGFADANAIPLVVDAGVSTPSYSSWISPIDSATYTLSYNGITAGSFRVGGGSYDGGSRYEVKSKSEKKRGTSTFYGIYLPYFYNYNYNAIKSAVKSGTCSVWLYKGTGTDINPPRGKGWKFKSRRKGDTWPGFSAKVIPITMTPPGASGGGDWEHFTCHGDSDPYGSMSRSALSKINGKTVMSCSGGTFFEESMRLYDSHYVALTCSVSVSGTCVFLPYFYGFNWTTIQNSVRSGTIMEWFQRN